LLLEQVELLSACFSCLSGHFSPQLPQITIMTRSEEKVLDEGVLVSPLGEDLGSGVIIASVLLIIS
jgi:hypothetical protein